MPPPAYSRADLVAAGRVLVNDSPSRSMQVHAAELLGQWRADHAAVMESFESVLRNRLASLDPEALVASRLKRTPSIVAKLRRMPELRLPSMQDIGGIRAVLTGMDELRTLCVEYRGLPAPLELANFRDYIGNPKNSGYRSVHLVYRNGPPPPGDGTFQFEFQIRTRLQHAWATAVETVDAFQHFSLKSGQGPDEWLEYFFLVAGAFAFHEGCPPHPEFAALGREATFRRTVEETRRLLVRERLRTYTTVLHDIAPGWDPDSYYLLEVEPIAQRTSWTAFPREQLGEASRIYTRSELRVADEGRSLVALVSAGTLENLKQAYPNYFLDTHAFVTILDHIADAV